MQKVISPFLKRTQGPQFERALFVKIIKEEYPDIVDDISDYVQGHLDYFTVMRHEDTYYILHRDSGTMIEWYKNLGRCNSCNKNIGPKDLREFIRLFKEDMKS